MVEYVSEYIFLIKKIQEKLKKKREYLWNF